MKYFIIPFLALGLVLSLLFGVEYDCQGEEMFPTYYGSPFVFKKQSLASSMEYYYSISGLLLNIAVWSGIIALSRWLVLYLIGLTQWKKVLHKIYTIFVGLLMVYAALNMAMSYVMLGRGFGQGSNYWYMDLDKEANNWGMRCEGDWGLLIQ